MTCDDLWTFNDVWNVALSPDGRRVALVRGNRDKEKNEYQRAILLLHLDEQGRAIGEPRQLTSGVKSDDMPAWSPDSQHLLFTSNRENEKNQLWLIDTNGGEPRKLTNVLHGVSEAAWSPDGRWIAFTASAAPTDDDEVLTGQKPLDQAARKKYDEAEKLRLRTINRVWYRLDGRGLFDTHSHLFVMPAPVADEPVDAATIRRLTSGDFGHGQLTWTPDSLEIVALCNRAENRDRSWTNDLWAIHRETGEARCLTDGSLEIGSYAWSPDGRQALVVGSLDRLEHGTSNDHLYSVPREGGELRPLTAHIDNPATPAAFAQSAGLPGPYRPQWNADGK
ncbi:MAG: TolB family protein, partial [Ktedonobacteraceae bacterium]